ncbi:glycerophosphodiester phosphodiesterase [Candidatus Pristimantibacillus sp. PTI5]|uniref:glycerophosphodiester phosphodiesterase n=1 Tax=Candidatus Pristimantibacillus sp. PTI5 TaxID=3400422 RepID=UPI003B01FECD
MKNVINFAHRGASGCCPENTLAAFQKALELGATGIETDVQLTKDGQVVVIHDESLARTAGLKKLVKDTEYEELSSLDAGSWFAPAFHNQRIPTLEQLLELLKPTDIVLNIELKNGSIPYLGIEEKVIRMVRDYRMTERVIISSFNHYSLVACKQLAPEIRTGILYMEGLYRPWDYAASLQADALHAYKLAVTQEWAAEAAAHGIVYHPFTVNDPSEMEALIDAGAAGIITDYPDRLAEILARRGASAG